MQEKVELPTVGRVVLYYSSMSSMATSPRAAMVADVVAGYTINLMVINSDGSSGGVSNIAHKDDAKLGQRYWDWMPYQKGQAAKTAQLQQELDQRVLDKKAQA